MSAQALYRKWRPQTFDAMVGQEHVTRTLRNALRSGRIGHAYLLTGPRGTGKTTTARLLAKAVNCLAQDPDDRPCNECSICQALNEGRLLDLIEIDAASNRGIDEIRELRERVGFRPNEARYKVYVIDEVHMLTEPAFNALLKTLEEPPPHIIFVLATTEPQKIPETILSRCQRFDLRRLRVDEIIGRLADLAGREGRRFEPEALRAIARHGAGSIRDAESLLDQLMSYDDENLTLEQVQAVLGTGSLQVIGDLVTHLISGDVAAGLDAINQAIDSGIAPRQFGRQVVEYLRGLMLIMIGDGEELLDLPAETIASMRNTAAEASLRQVIRALKLFNEAGRALKGSLHPQLPLELAFIEAATPDQAGPGALPQIKDDTGTQARPVAHVPASAPRATTVAAPSPATAYAAPPPEPERPPTSVQTPAKTGGGISLEVARSQWTEILQAVRPQSRSVEALLKSGYPENVVGNTIIIGFEHEFHKRKIKDGENSRLVEDAIQQVLGQPCRVECELASRPATQPVATPGPQASPAKTGPSPVQTQETPSAARRREAVQDPVIQVAVEELGAQVVDVTDNQ